MCSCGPLFGVPAVIASGLLSEVDRFGWDVFGVTVGGEPDGPAVLMNALLMNDVVVEVAEQDAVAEVGFAALGPGTIRVVNFAPVGWPVATGERTSAVPVGDRDPLMAGKEPFASSHVQRE